jgi:catechol 2,3-dioxygenase-like lactoylglutathione lyase family enzyme
MCSTRRSPRSSAEVLRSVRHVGVVVSDLDASLAFYRDLLGLEPLRELDESGPHLDAMLALEGVRVRTVKLRAPGGDTLVELLHFAAPPAEPRVPRLAETGPTHLAFTVDDLDTLHARLVAAGVRFNAPPQASPDGLAKVAFCLDPDGTPLELVEELR